MHYKINTLEQLQQSVDDIYKNVSDKEVFLLKGALGTGKSTWVRQFLTKAGLDKKIPSPTFSIYNYYQIKDHPVHHMDLYRIKNEDELESSELRDILKQEKGWIFIEWADMIQLNQIPDRWSKTTLDFQLKDEVRSLNVERYKKN